MISAAIAPKIFGVQSPTAESVDEINSLTGLMADSATVPNPLLICD